MTHRTLIYDVSNLIWRAAAVEKRGDPALIADDPEIVGLSLHIALRSMLKWFQRYRPDFVVFAFDNADNWRKAYTAREQTRLQYKGNRTSHTIDSPLYAMVGSFYATMRDHTSICCLNIDSMEADDAVAGYCQLFAKEGNEIYIISGDRDFIGLLKLPGVMLVNPDDGKLRNQPGDKDYFADINYWTFLKCVRGDMGDYVPAAYPRAREARIAKAYKGRMERMAFMRTVWEDKEGKKFKVEDEFKHNVTLLDLFKQPRPQRKLLAQVVRSQVEEFGSYSPKGFSAFLDEHKLAAIKRDADAYAELFANNKHA